MFGSGIRAGQRYWSMLRLYQREARTHHAMVLDLELSPERQAHQFLLIIARSANPLNAMHWERFNLQQLIEDTTDFIWSEAWAESAGLTSDQWEEQKRSLETYIQKVWITFDKGIHNIIRRMNFPGQTAPTA